MLFVWACIEDPRIVYFGGEAGAGALSRYHGSGSLSGFSLRAWASCCRLGSTTTRENGWPALKLEAITAYEDQATHSLPRSVAMNAKIKLWGELVLVALRGLCAGVLSMAPRPVGVRQRQLSGSGSRGQSKKKATSWKSNRGCTKQAKTKA